MMSITCEVKKVRRAGQVFSGDKKSAPSIGLMLRGWRERRHCSQLALSIETGVSTKHLSFIETGRAMPSREMLLCLAEYLQVPHRERNMLLVAGGYAPEYKHRPFDDPALSEVRETVNLFLTSLEPCPGLAIDRQWNLLAGNRMANHLLAGVAPELLREPLNVLRVSLHPHGLAPRIANLPQWHGYVLNRLRRDIELTGDAFLISLQEELRSYPMHQTADGADVNRENDDGIMSVAIPFCLRTEAGVLSFLSTTTVFGSAIDVTVAELAIESFLPADDYTVQILRRLMESF